MVEPIVRIIGKIPEYYDQSKIEIEGHRLLLSCGQLTNPADDHVRHGKICPTKMVKYLSCGEG